MRGRHYIDSEIADEIKKVVHNIDQRIRQKHFARDILPTNDVPIIEKLEHRLKLDICKWRYPVSQGKKPSYKCKNRICYGQTSSFSSVISGFVM